MAQVTVTAQYVADTAAYVRGVRQATDATNEFARNLPQAEQAQDKLKASTVGLSAALGTLGGLLFAKASGAVMKYAQQGIAAAKQYEQTVISMEGIFAGTGMSMEQAAAKTESYLAELRDFAAKTPFELPQTLDAVKRLLSIGYAADDVKQRLLPTIGDIVAALGQPPSAISAVVYAFGQMKSAGRVLSQDLMQIGNALPGFNARMAIANEMFQGDFGAMTKAMESGALNSDQAIDVIITAMQKFGGASGAMARQSETLAGVMSTFSDTVNNALIDGLMPSLPALSAALNEVMPAVSDMATAFAQALGPALIDGAAMMGQMAPAASAIIPPLIELASQVTVLGDVFMALSPMIILAADAVGAIASLISMLPDPVFAAIGAIVAFRLVMKKLGIDAGVATTQVGTAFLRIKTSAIGTMDTVRLHFMLGGVSLKTFATLAQTAGAKVVAAFRIMGGAARGFMASLGPVGIALIGFTVAMEVFMSRSADTQARVDELKTTVDELTGSFTEASAASVAATFRSQISQEDIDRMADFGITIQGMTAAALEGGPAAEAMVQKITEAQNSLDNINEPTIEMLQTVKQNFKQAAAVSEQTRREFEIDSAARADAAAIEAQKVMAAGYAQMAEIRKREIENQRALENMTDAERSHAHFVENKSLAMARATEAAKNAIEGLNSATQNLTDALSAEATYDNARQGIIDLSKELKEGDKKLKGYSQAALDNRAAIRDAAQGYIDYANSLTDPIERQNALEEGQERIRKALEKAGIDPEKSDILKTLKEQSEQSGKTVDEFAKQRQIASQYGNDVGKNFIDGIIAELEAGKDKVDLTAAGATAGMPDAANAAIEADSPSRAAMRVAKNFIDGIAAGVAKDKKLAEMKVSELGQGMLDALQNKLDEFASKMETAGGALGNLGDLTFGTEGKFGLPSQIQEMFGEGASASGILGGYGQLSQSVQELFAPLMDAEIVPPNVIRKNKRLMDQAMSDLDSYTQFAVTKVKEREDAQRRLADLDRKYRDDVEAINTRYNDLEKAAAAEAKGIEDRFKSLQSTINARYDGMDKAAQANIKRIEDHYKQLIPTLEAALKEANAAYDRENKVLQDLLSERDGFLGNIQKGFRSFLNNVKVDGDKASKTITRVTERMINGIKVLTSETFTEETGGGGFADALQSRLDSLRNFTNNIRTLLSRGLDPTLVQDFVSAGIDSAGDTVAALAAGSDEQLAQVNSAQAELGSLIGQFTTDASAAWFDYGIAQQQAVVAPLEAAAAAAQLALDQAQLARDTELAAAQAHAEQLRLQRQAELAAIQAERDAELERVRAYQEQLRVDRETELKKAADDYDKQKTAIDNELKAIEVALAANAVKINDTFVALRARMLPMMKRFGNRIVNGLIRGMEEREGALFAKADAIAGGIRARIEAAFNFGSPSRVTRKMGEQIAEGLIVGMNSELRNVERAADALAGAVMAPLMMPSMSAVGAMAPVGAMGARTFGGGSGSSISITVNAGMGADGAEVGRQVVEAIRKYERRTGPVFVSA